MSFGQFAATSQFYLYGRQYCTATGYENSMKGWLKKNKDILQDPDLSLENKVCIVTGANSGVGFEVAKYLASKGAMVVMLCRNKARGEAAQQDIIKETGSSVDKVVLIVADLSLEADVRRAWAEFAASAPRSGAAPRLDVLVCNAGVLLNEKTLTNEGVETTFACHLLFGTYLLGKLAMPSLVATEASRVVVVSSGGMYNTKWPAFDVAAARDATTEYSGNMAYAYCKRGQVLLCERWARAHPTVKFVSCHPGWTQTPAVDAAYGAEKRYLEPLRSPWQGAEGIAWLCAVKASELEQGGFYLDRVPRAKHIAGPFFTEGAFTKNSEDEVDALMAQLEIWSAAATRPPLPTPEDEAAARAEAVARERPLVAMKRPQDLERFMGRWVVRASIGTAFERGMMNCVEEYSWDAAAERVDVTFTMQASPSAAPTVVEQRMVPADKAVATEFAITPKLGGLWMPFSFTYLVLAVTDDYEACMIGVPNRAYLWIMTRGEPGAGVVERLKDLARRLGYDPSKIKSVPYDSGGAEVQAPE